MTGIEPAYSAWEGRAYPPVREEPRTRSYWASIVDSGWRSTGRPRTTLAVMTPNLTMPKYVDGLNIVGQTVRVLCSFTGRSVNRSRSHLSVMGADSGCNSR